MQENKRTQDEARRFEQAVQDRPVLVFQYGESEKRLPINVVAVTNDVYQAHSKEQISGAVSRPDQLTVIMPVLEEQVDIIHHVLARYRAECRTNGLCTTVEKVGRAIDQALNLGDAVGELYIHIGTEMEMEDQAAGMTAALELLKAYKREHEARLD